MLTARRTSAGPNWAADPEIASQISSSDIYGHVFYVNYRMTFNKLAFWKWYNNQQFLD